MEQTERILNGADYRASRKGMGLTQQQLADRFGIGRDTVVAREAGRSRLILEHWYALAALEDELALKALKALEAE